MLTPVGEHELLVFWLQLVVLLGAARGLGGLMKRVGQPAVIGELGAGLILGPSVFGRLAPGLAGWLFPGGEVESALILAVAWIGIVFLLTVTGFETDLRLIKRLGRSATGVTVGSLVVPLALGVGLGYVLPETFIGEQGSRGIFAAFIAVALSISALPVIAKILQDMNLMRRNFGQLTIAAGMVNDTVGWLLLGALTAVVHTGEVNLSGLGLTLGAIAVFIILAFTVGQRAVDWSLRKARRGEVRFEASLTVTLLIVFAAGAITHAIGMEAVIGAFVIGIVLGRSRYLPTEVEHSIEHLSHAVFAPIFFATAGLYVDLGALADPAAALGALAVLVVAAVSKLAGSYWGGRLSRLTPVESLAAGIGLNARGAMEIVLAAIGLRLAVLNGSSYAAIVLMAMVTSMAAPPLLRPVLRRLEATPEETERLEREELLAASIIASAESALLPTRGGANSVMAARMLDQILQPQAGVTVLTVGGPGEEDPGQRIARAREVTEAFAVLDPEFRHATADDAVAEILEEAQLGYDLMALGLNEEFRGTHELSHQLQRMIAGCEVPVLLVRRAARAHSQALDGAPVRRILVPVTGTVVGLAAEEIAFVLASRMDAEVDAVHVVTRPDPERAGAHQIESQLQRSRTLSRRFGRTASSVLRVAPVPYEGLLDAATERQTDLIVTGTQVRSHEGRPFLGHGTEYLLENASAAVAVIVFPAGTQ
ncbi:MAG: cation:proton antiporter [Actinobacteria bacterium]|nr:cation:proton antiporter [Actinomycetota bacterium]